MNPLSFLHVLIIGIGFFLFPIQGSTQPNINVAKIPLIRIHTDQLTPLQIGLKIGQKSKALFPDIEKDYDTYLATLLNPSLYRQLQQNTLPKLLKNLDPAYREELNGVVAAWTLTRKNRLGDGLLSLSEYQLLNLLPDLGFAPSGTGFGVIGKMSINNTPIIGRNLDWKNTSSLRHLQAITVYQGSDTALVNIGFAGIISVLTGFNHHGVFLAHYKAAPYSPYKQMSRLTKNVHSNVFSLRKALETSESNQQATHALSRQTYPEHHSILMTDKKNIQVLEYFNESTAKIRQWNSPTQTNKPWGKQQQVAVIGCHVLASLPNNCKEIKQGYQWNRLRQLAQFTTSTPASSHDIANLLFDTKNNLFEIFNASTLQSMIYQPENNSLYLYTALSNGSTSHPVHHAYLGLIPAKLRNQNTNGKHFTLLLISSLLLISFVVVFWISWQDKVSTYRKGNF